jgi:hypothetical protein
LDASKNKYSLRFNPPPKWNQTNSLNRYFFGLIEFNHFILNHFEGKGNLKMMEMGSYRGESTFMWASSGQFQEIIAVDPFEGETDNKNEYFNDNWSAVKREFWTNTRYFNNVKLVQDYNFNVINNYPDQYFDFIYIDASHDYESVKRDIQISLPKIKNGGLIGGHDYEPTWKGVIKAVDEIFEKPTKTFMDESWVKVKS